MAWQYTPFTFLLILSASLIIGLAYGVWRYRTGPARLPFLVFMVALAHWSLASAGQFMNVGLAEKLLWDQLTYVGIVIVPTAWLVFILTYTGHESWLTRRRLALLCVEPVLTLVVVWTNPFHGLYATESTLVSVGSVVVLDQTYGPWFWLNVVYSYLLIVVGMGFIVRLIISDRGVYRRQAASLLTGAMVPWVANIAFVLSVGPIQHLDLTPLAFVVMGIIFAWALLRYRLLELVPMAHRTVTKDIPLGVLVVDVDRRVVDSNSAAERILGLLGSDVVGRRIDSLLPLAPELFEQIDGETDVHRELEFDTAESANYLDVRISSLTDRDDRLVGTVVILQDITTRKLREQRLAVLTRILRHNVRNDLNVLLGHIDLLERHVDGDVDHHLKAVRSTGTGLLETSEKAATVRKALQDSLPNQRPIELVSLLDDALDSVCQEYPCADVTTEFPDVAWASGSEEIGIAVTELVENAIQHTHNSPPTVRVSVSATEGADGWITVAIEDDGPGIPEVERDVLTEGRETPLEHGSGLGLWLVNWIVTAVGGRLRFDSSELGGSKVLMQFRRTSPESV